MSSVGLPVTLPQATALAVDAVVALPESAPTNVAAEMFLLDSQRLLVLCHLISALDPSTTRPEPVDDVEQ